MKCENCPAFLINENLKPYCGVDEEIQNKSDFGKGKSSCQRRDKDKIIKDLIHNNEFVFDYNSKNESALDLIIDCDDFEHLQDTYIDDNK